MKTHTEDRYSRAVKVIDWIAKDCCNLELSDETVTRWGYALDLIQVVDDILDEGDSQMKNDLMDMLELVLGTLNSSELPDRENFDTLPEVLQKILLLRYRLTNEESTEFLEYGERVISVTEKLKTIDNVSEYSRQLRLEGQLTLHMLDAVVCSRDKEKPEYREFYKLLKMAARSGNVFDSITDLSTDKQNGITVVEPSIKARYDMFKACSGDLCYCAKKLGFRAVKLTKPLLGIYMARNV